MYPLEDKPIEFFAGFVGKGWYKLMEDLINKLLFISKTFNVIIIPTQIKEKFGSLRFYYVTISDNFKGTEEELKLVDDIIFDIVSYAEGLSARTCENCGKLGEIVEIGGWLTALCNSCLLESKNKIK